MLETEPISARRGWHDPAPRPSPAAHPRPRLRHRHLEGPAAGSPTGAGSRSGHRSCRGRTGRPRRRRRGDGPVGPPGDDFFRYANGTWLKETEIPADRSAWGDLRRARGAARPSAGAPRGRGRSSAARRVAGTQGGRLLRPRWTRPRPSRRARAAPAGSLAHREAHDRTALATYLGEELRADVDAMDCNPASRPRRLFGLWVAPDLNPDAQRALPPPGRPRHAGPRVLPVHRPHHGRDPRQVPRARRDHPYPGGHQGRGEARCPGGRPRDEDGPGPRHARSSPSRSRTPTTPGPGPSGRSGHRASTGRASSQAAGLAGQPVVVPWHPKATAGLSALVAHEPLEAWMDWATYHAVDRRSAFLGKAFQDEAFAFYGSVLSGTAEQPARWKRAQRLDRRRRGRGGGPPLRRAPLHAPGEGQGLGDGEVHRRGLRPPDRRARLDGAVDQGGGQGEGAGALRRRRLPRPLGGLRRDSRSRATISSATWSAPVSSIASRSSRSSASRWTGRVVHAPARGQRGEPAGAQRAELPGGHPRAALLRARRAGGGQLRRPSAATIGHEISHSFDDQGALFDADGQAPELVDAGGPRALPGLRCALAAQFDGYRPFPDLHVNGKQTLSENIADLAGLAAAHDAWSASLGGAPAPVVKAVSAASSSSSSPTRRPGEPRSASRCCARPLMTDGHAPAQYRAFSGAELSTPGTPPST